MEFDESRNGKSEGDMVIFSIQHPPELLGESLSREVITRGEGGEVESYVKLCSYLQWNPIRFVMGRKNLAVFMVWPY